MKGRTTEPDDAADADVRQLAALDQLVDGASRDPEQERHLRGRHELSRLGPRTAHERSPDDAPEAGTRSTRQSGWLMITGSLYGEL